MTDRQQIFISYRRESAEAYARVLYEKLRDEGYTVFYDRETMPPGNYLDNIRDAVEGCADFLVILAPGSLDRCADEKDVMGQEIAWALASGRNILPVFIHGFRMEDVELPEHLRDLTQKHGIEWRMEYFNAVYDSIIRRLHAVPEDPEMHVALRQIKSQVLDLDHGYFRKWMRVRLEEFLMDNREMLSGNNRTDPHSEETFGVTGLPFTRKNLKALATVKDYWNDSFTRKYLQTQADLIREKQVEITRIFVVAPDRYAAALEQMDYQSKLGIHVYYIKTDNPFIDPLWLTEDYLIQDDRLLVQIHRDTQKFCADVSGTEEITMEHPKVARKIERFNRLLERAERYVPERAVLDLRVLEPV